MPFSVELPMVTVANRAASGLLALSLILSGCDSTTGPADFDVSGTWRSSGSIVTDVGGSLPPLTLSLLQDGRSVAGTWSLETLTGGDVSGAVLKSMQLELTLGCCATINASLNVSDGRLVGTLNGLIFVSLGETLGFQNAAVTFVRN